MYEQVAVYWKTTNSDSYDVFELTITIARHI